MCELNGVFLFTCYFIIITRLTLVLSNVYISFTLNSLIENYYSFLFRTERPHKFFCKKNLYSSQSQLKKISRYFSFESQVMFFYKTINSSMFLLIIKDIQGQLSQRSHMVVNRCPQMAGMVPSVEYK